MAVSDAVADAMWNDGKKIVDHLVEVKRVLRSAKQKLELYRGQHSGEYVGGMEYTELMRQIDAALNL